MYGDFGPYFDAALNVTRPNQQDLSALNPLLVPVNSSLVSSISAPQAGALPQLQTAAILTVLPAPPPAGSFRPPYSGSDKTIRFNRSRLNHALLSRLPPVSGTPDLAAVERLFERPWLDHVPNWPARFLHPLDNMPDYGREMSTQVGIGALMLHLNFSAAAKETLLVRFVQLGIDLYGIARDGGNHNWTPAGGQTSGRKWPVLFAGLLLNDAAMRGIGPGDGTGAVEFSEDGQTFFVTQADIERSHAPDTRGCYAEEYTQADLGLAEWGISHSTELSIYFSTHQFALPDGDDQRVHAWIVQGAIEHGLELGAVAAGVVSHQQAARDQARNDHLVDFAVDFFFRIQEAEGDLVVLAEVLTGVAGDQFDDRLDAGQAKRCAG